MAAGYWPLDISVHALYIRPCQIYALGIYYAYFHASQTVALQPDLHTESE